MRTIEPSELVINSDGSIFHLHIRPEQLAEHVLLLGDPDRVGLLRPLLNPIEHEGRNREFVWVTGYFKTQKVTFLSTGIGTDNIDIVMNELDALVNIDFDTRTVKDKHTSLNILRLGTSGAIQPGILPGTLVFSSYSAGIDGLLNWYAGRNSVSDLDLEQAFIQHMQWPEQLADPYFVRNSERLEKKFPDAVKGITLSAPGFYGPQGRVIRIPLADPDYMPKLVSFKYKGLQVTNIEMEGSAIAGLSRLLGHQGATICLIIAQRDSKDMKVDYKGLMLEKASEILERMLIL